jgi:hypothetical protein
MAKITVSVEEFRVVFPEFSDVQKYSNEVIAAQINAACVYIPLTETCALKGDKRKRAIYLLSAVLLVQAANMQSKNGQGAAGAVVSASIGSVSTTFSVPQKINEFTYWLYSFAPYGTELAMLMKSLGAGGIYVGGSYENVLL